MKTSFADDRPDTPRGDEVPRDGHPSWAQTVAWYLIAAVGGGLLAEFAGCDLGAAPDDGPEIVIALLGGLAAGLLGLAVVVVGVDAARWWQNRAARNTVGGES